MTERSAWYVYLLPAFDEIMFVARCTSKREADRLVRTLRLHVLESTGRDYLVRTERIGASRARRHALEERVRAVQARARAGDRSLDAIAARAAMSLISTEKDPHQQDNSVSIPRPPGLEGRNAGPDNESVKAVGLSDVARVGTKADVALDPHHTSDDAGDFRPAACFPKGMAARLRMAASPRRKTKRVATRVIDGVVCYSVADVTRWWPHDLKLPLPGINVRSRALQNVRPIS